jgi:hypothetical protein
MQAEPLRHRDAVAISKILLRVAVGIPSAPEPAVRNTNDRNAPVTVTIAGQVVKHGRPREVLTNPQHSPPRVSQPVHQGRSVFCLKRRGLAT